MKKILIIIIVIIVAYFVWHSLHKKPNAVTNNIVKVRQGDIKQNAVAVGYIIPKHATVVKSPIDGIVGQIFHDSGEYVQAGTALLRITPDPKPTDLARALSAIDNDKAMLTAATRQKASYDKLLKQGIITKNFSQYLTTISQLKQSQAQLKFDQQQLDLMQKGETTIAGKPMHNTISAPIAGYILARDVDVGDPVVALGGATPATELFTIANMNDLIFQGDVDETDANRLHTGMLANIEIAALPKAKIQGKLKLLALQSEQQNTATTEGPAASTAASTSSSVFNVGFQIRVEDLNIPKTIKLRSGYSATATITVDNKKNVLLIPERVLIFKDNKTFVKIPSGKTTKLVEITTGVSDGINTEVLSGLTQGEAVIDGSQDKDSSSS